MLFSRHNKVASEPKEAEPAAPKAGLIDTLRDRHSTTLLSGLRRGIRSRSGSLGSSLTLAGATAIAVAINIAAIYIVLKEPDPQGSNIALAFSPWAAVYLAYVNHLQVTEKSKPEAEDKLQQTRPYSPYTPPKKTPYEQRIEDMKWAHDHNYGKDCDRCWGSRGYNARIVTGHRTHYMSVYTGGGSPDLRAVSDPYEHVVSEKCYCACHKPEYATSAAIMEYTRYVQAEKRRERRARAATKAKRKRAAHSSKA